MKTLIGLIIAIAVIAGGYYYFVQPSQENGVMEKEHDAMMMEDGSVPSAGTYTVVSEESRVDWTAAKPLIAGYVHHGTIAVSDGTITIGENTASGSFTIDMSSVKVTSLGGGKEGQESQLENHLKADDFFGVETYPTASFVITGVVPTATENEYTLTGDLTLKDTTQSVSFPAHIYEKDGKVFATAEFSIDRTQWGITFGSSSVFSSLAENAIGDDVTLSLHLVAQGDTAMMVDDGSMEEN